MPSRHGLTGDLRPSRYVLAGSTGYAAIPTAAQALTGRVDIIPILPLTQGEIDGVRETFVTELVDGDDIEGPPPGTAAATREEYARRAALGGCQWPCAARQAVSFPVVRQLRRPGTGQGRYGHPCESNSARCCPGCWARLPPGQGRCST